MTLLDAEKLTVTFGGLTALNSLRLQASEGEIVGLIGPNGSGKTTFFNVITGIYRATAGNVRFAGEDITGWSTPNVYRAGITRTFQRSRLALPLTVLDNVVIGNQVNLSLGIWANLISRTTFERQLRENTERIQSLLAIFSPELSRRIYDPVARLSMIDRRRVEICRALISHPKLLLLDEPSAGMTHDETRELMDDILLVRRQMAGLTIVIIEHEMEVIKRITDRCVVLNFGEKVAEGSYQEVATSPVVQEAYLGVA